MIILLYKAESKIIIDTNISNLTQHLKQCNFSNKSTCTSPELCDFEILSIPLWFEKKIGKISEIDNVIEEVIQLAIQINLEVDSDDIQKLWDSHNHELTIDEHKKLHEQDIESLDPVQSEDRMTVENLTKCLRLIEKGLQISENID
ncbi:tigger transposable element-derived protein 1 [Trichonephila clavipes]|nr:tigger transposable element-derived protein 1 [Trichonephila clavipes]